MTWLFPITVLAVLIGVSWQLGRYMHRAMAPAAPGSIRNRGEAFAVAVIGSRAAADQDWKRYALSMLVFNLGCSRWPT
ncbi:MAG: potassium-transporting ATPase subunit KdpA [Salinisphaera sp.]|jgi:K+-transporting ATPase A subunit|nr:potassium-transporting ATPase subunit KdpA [Salinisphaera sp.]